MDKHMENRRERGALLAESGQGYGASPSEMGSGLECGVNPFGMRSARGKKRNWDRIRTGLLTAVAVMLVMSAAMGTAWAYFTTYTMARGGVVLHMGHEEKVKEEFSSWQKKLNISSTEDSRPVYIRAHAFCADYDVTYAGDHWTTETVDGETWAYYVPDSKTLQPGTDLAAAGDELKVMINDVPSSTEDGVKDGDTFNVIVVYETTEVQYDENGEPLSSTQADWNGKVDTSRKSTTLGGEG